MPFFRSLEDGLLRWLPLIDIMVVLHMPIFRILEDGLLRWLNLIGILAVLHMLCSLPNFRVCLRWLPLIGILAVPVWSTPFQVSSKFQLLCNLLQRTV